MAIPAYNIGNLLVLHSHLTSWVQFYCLGINVEQKAQFINKKLFPMMRFFKQEWISPRAYLFACTINTLKIQGKHGQPSSCISTLQHTAFSISGKSYHQTLRATSYMPASAHMGVKRMKCDHKLFCHSPEECHLKLSPKPHINIKCFATVIPAFPSKLIAMPQLSDSGTFFS